MSETKKTYTIGTRKFTQEQITSGQIKQIKATLSDSDIKFDSLFNAADVVKTLADKAGLVVCILICEEGTKLKDKNPEQLEEELSFELFLNKQTEIIKDFFQLTPLTSIWAQIQQTLQTLIKINLNSMKELGVSLNKIEGEETEQEA